MALGSLSDPPSSIIHNYESLRILHTLQVHYSERLVSIKHQSHFNSKRQEWRTNDRFFLISLRRMNLKRLFTAAFYHPCILTSSNRSHSHNHSMFMARALVTQTTATRTTIGTSLFRKQAFSSSKIMSSAFRGGATGQSKSILSSTSSDGKIS